ncbi:TlpA disulfide reductase family protein [Bartonella machadoae]|uniref:TlpA disulfide reductase family protein n=1 Tax=Bartonella machadoae TaxID=2893471 RepID=UPI001F4CB2F2|nr:TlpA disulfide reductase family protein [Bartonella machadoae]UNE54150.1 TlpA family protein disulfide reductase [Bartonella machadoae]
MIPQNFTNQNKKNKKRLFITSFFAVIILAAISLYALKSPSDKREFSFTNFISGEKTAKFQKEQEEKMRAIQKAAKGFFTHIRFADTPLDMTQLSFKDIQGNNHKLSEFTGKPILVNLWASWCAPCRTEMPELAQLKRELAGENFDVMAINIDKTTSPEKIQQFLQDVHAENLLYYRDETMDIFNNVRKQGLALGLPITFLIDKKGHLIASFNGAAPWANNDAKTLIKAVIKEAL